MGAGARGVPERCARGLERSIVRVVLASAVGIVRVLGLGRFVVLSLLRVIRSPVLIGRFIVMMVMRRVVGPLMVVMVAMARFVLARMPTVAVMMVMMAVERLVLARVLMIAGGKEENGATGEMDVVIPMMDAVKRRDEQECDRPAQEHEDGGGPPSRWGRVPADAKCSRRANRHDRRPPCQSRMSNLRQLLWTRTTALESSAS